jgi:predicted component of type VI protein secretion system
MMMRGRLAMTVLSVALVTALSGCERSSPAASSQAPPENLAARVKALEDLIPSQSHMMADVGDDRTCVADHEFRPEGRLAALS